MPPPDAAPYSRDMQKYGQCYTRWRGADKEEQAALLLRHYYAIYAIKDNTIDIEQSEYGHTNE